MNEISTLRVHTVLHVPISVHPLLFKFFQRSYSMHSKMASGVMFDLFLLCLLKRLYGFPHEEESKRGTLSKKFDLTARPLAARQTSSIWRESQTRFTSAPFKFFYFRILYGCSSIVEVGYVMRWMLWDHRLHLHRRSYCNCSTHDHQRFIYSNGTVSVRFVRGGVRTHRPVSSWFKLARFVAPDTGAALCESRDCYVI